LHGHFPKLEGGDLLIIGGDLTSLHAEEEFYDFANWLRNQDYEDRIVIDGNHDTWLAEHADSWDIENWCDTGEFEYLLDSGTQLENGMKIWGSPWTLKFKGMNPKCMAFTCDTEEELEKKWELIPDDMDILVTHSPPFSIKDGKNPDQNLGSPSLMKKISNLQCLKLHTFGHIHEGYGMQDMRWLKLKNGFKAGIYINASHVNEYYEPVNKPVRVIL